MINAIRNAPKKIWNMLQMLWRILFTEKDERDVEDYWEQVANFAHILGDNVWYVEGQGDPEILATALGTLGFVDMIVIGDDLTTAALTIASDATTFARYSIRDRLITQGWEAITPAEEMSLEKIRRMVTTSQRHASLK